MNYGERIKTMRMTRGWSQAELASKIKVGTSTIGMWEINKREPNFEMIEALADAFNVSINDIIGAEMTKEEALRVMTRGAEMDALRDMMPKLMKLNEDSLTKLLNYAEFLLASQES